MDLKKVYVSIYSFGYGAGFVDDKRRRSTPLSLDDLVSMTRSLGLGGIEIPIDRYFANSKTSEIVSWVDNLRGSGLGVTFDLESFAPNTALQAVKAIHAAGLKILRIKMSNLYGGNRYKVTDYNKAFQAFVRDLKELAPALKQLGVRLVIENHQDISAEELLHVIAATSPEQIGVNWDTGSSFALGETDLSFLTKVNAFVGNIHIKDYRLYINDVGIKLVRCALGEGVVNFKEAFARLNLEERQIPMAIELGAHVARQSDIFVPEFWQTYSNHLAEDRCAFFGFVANRGIRENGSNWQTPWERGDSPEEVLSSEYAELKRSVDFLSTL